MSNIKAIETSYKGHRFRSRLEARWAVAFDALGVEWQYEPQGFEIRHIHADESDAPEWRWLPDFYLPMEMCWVEVKGDLSKLDSEMLTHAVDYGGQIPHVGHGWGTTRGILVLGEIPRPSPSGYRGQWNDGFTCHPIIQHHKGVVVNAVAFGFEKFEKRYHESQPGDKDYVTKKLCFIDSEFDGWDQGDACSDPIKVGVTYFTQPVAAWQWSARLDMSGSQLWQARVIQEAAYEKARRARFEHGEQG